MIVGALFVAACVAMLRFDPSAESHAAAWLGILFFGGGALLLAVASASRMIRPNAPVLRIDERGITWLQRSPGLLRRFHVGGDRFVMAWADVAGFKLVSLSGPAPTRPASWGYRDHLAVGIIPRDFASAPRGENRLQNRMRAFLFRRFGAMPTPPHLELPAHELLALLEHYRAGASQERLAGFIT